MTNNWETPFESAEQAFFYMAECQRYQASGAKVGTGGSMYIRPCGPNDIRIVIERLFRERKLNSDHVKALKMQGMEGFRPPPDKAKHFDDALSIIEEELKKKGIVR